MSDQAPPGKPLRALPIIVGIVLLVRAGVCASLFLPGSF